MSDLQSFGNAVAVAETAAPRNHGSNFSRVAGAVSNGLGVVSDLVENNQKQATAREKASNAASVAQGFRDNEVFKRREPLREALASGQLSASQVAQFGVDEASSLAALDQAAGQGMGHSVRNALERSVRYQFAAMKNPGAAKELAAAYGIGNSSEGQDTLDAIEAIERDRLKADANQVRELAANEGYQEFLGKGDEEVIEMWLDSPASQRERQIKQSQRSALSQESSIEERAIPASRAMSLEMSKIGNTINSIANNYEAARGNSNTGSTGGVALADQLNLWAEDTIAGISRTYKDFPKLVEAYSTGVRRSVEDRLTARKSGLEQSRLEHNVQVMQPLAEESQRLQIVRTAFDNQRNPIRAVEDAAQLSINMSREMRTIAGLQDEILNQSPAEQSPSMIAYLQGEGNAQALAQYKVASEMGVAGLNMLLDPASGAQKKAADTAATTLGYISRTGGVAANEAATKQVVADLATAHQYNVSLSPSKAAVIEEAVGKLADDPRFIEMAKDSPAVRPLLAPYAASVKSEIIQKMQDSLDIATTTKVNAIGNPNLPGSRETRISLWRKMGQYMVLDKKGTDAVGVPQYKLVNNITEALSTEDIADQQAALDEHNQYVQRTSQPSRYKLLKNLTGATSISAAVTSVVESSDGIALESLSPTREIADRNKEAIARDEAPVATNRNEFRSN